MIELRLRALALGGAQMLSRAQMRNIVGGYENCNATNNFQTANCGSSGSPPKEDCNVSCYVTCTDSCGNAYTSCKDDIYCGPGY